MGLFDRKPQKQIAWDDVLLVSPNQTRAQRKELIAQLDKIQLHAPELFTDICRRLNEQGMPQIEIGFNIRKDDNTNHIHNNGDRLIINLSHSQLQTSVYEGKDKSLQLFTITQAITHELSRAADKTYFRQYEKQQEARDSAIKHLSGFADFCEKRGVTIEHGKSTDEFLANAEAAYHQNPNLARAFNIRHPIGYINYYHDSKAVYRAYEKHDEATVERSNNIMASIEDNFTARSKYNAVYEVRKAEPAIPSKHASERASEIIASSNMTLKDQESHGMPSINYEIRKAILIKN